TNHPFVGGNKRTGFRAAFVFLGTNKIDFAARTRRCAPNPGPDPGSRSIAQQSSNPIAFSAIQDRFSFAVLEAGVQSTCAKGLDDLTLSGFGVVGSGATAAGILHGQMKRR